MNKKLHVSPAYLFIGPEATLEDVATAFIKNVFCLQSKGQDRYCNLCLDCQKVNRKIHHNIIWLEPENYYVTSDLEPVFKAAAFGLGEGEHFFFVISKAQQLSQVCANSLLKLIEEPPRGYHFILTAQTKERILPTISSRCIVYNYAAESQADSIFLPFFNKLDNPEFERFNQVLQSAKIIDSDVTSLLDQIYSFWMTTLKSSIQKQDENHSRIAQRILAMIDQYRIETLMPGSGKIFLRNLYMQFMMIKSEV